LRVVDVTQWWSPTSGGIRTYLMAKARFAAGAGLAHAAIVTGERPAVLTVGASPIVAVRGRTPAERWGYRLAPLPGPMLAQLERLEPDVVVVHDALAFPRAIRRWAADRGVAVAMFCHSDLALGAARLPGAVARPARGLLRLVQRRGLTAVRTVLVASRASEARIARDVRGRVVHAPLGVDLDAFTGARPDPALRARLAPPGAPLLLHAGRLSGDKRVDLLPPALAALAEAAPGPGERAVLVVAGSGAAEPSLRRGAARLGVADRMRFLGHVADRGRLAALMATADCFVHPNPSEPYGLCPLEALAAGCRVVAPASEGCAETLAGRGAVLVAPGDPAALAAGVARALAGPRPRADLSGLSWEAAFAAEWDLYREMAGIG
jgi:alpha-1,6-mannosyltransferase